MLKRSLPILFLALAASAQMTEIAAERIRAHVKFLSSDLLEGRGVGTRGGQIATEYIATQLTLAGVKPAGDNGTYFQNFTLIGVDPQPESSLTATTRDGQTHSGLVAFESAARQRFQSSGVATSR